MQQDNLAAPIGVNPHAVYEGSDGEATKALYAKLEKLGSAGIIALNLFRAQKASTRAKLYTQKFKGKAYDKKNWSLALLCVALGGNAEELGIEYGWKADMAQEYHKWVLYIELPTGQVSFHAATALSARLYSGEWDGTHESATRILAYTESVLQKEKSFTQ